MRRSPVGLCPVNRWVNLVEVDDRIERDRGRRTADEILTSLRRGAMTM